jgi:hypothetical protein
MSMCGRMSVWVLSRVYPRGIDVRGGIVVRLRDVPMGAAVEVVTREVDVNAEDG